MKSHIDDLTKQTQVNSETQQACLWVPSCMLVVHQVPIPNAPKRKWSALIPWMLEEKLLQKPEDMHFVIVGKSHDNLSVLVCAKSQMQEWQQAVEASGINNYALVPDFFALPWQSGIISIAQRAEQILVRYSEYEGFSAYPEVAWHMLDNLLQASTGQTKLSVSLAEAELPLRFQDRVEFSNQNVDWHNAAFPARANLLQGEFSRATNSFSYKPWLSTAALLILAIALSLFALNLDASRLNNEIASLREENRLAFYSLFPGLTIRGDVRATIERYISNRFKQRESLRSEVMLALTTIDSAMTACNCDLQSLQWNSAGLQLSLPMSAENIVEQWQFDGYTKQIRAEADTGLLLTLTEESQQ